MRTSSWLTMMGLTGLLVGGAASCSDDSGGEALTVTTGATTSTTSAGGDSTTSTGGTGGTTTTAATGGAGGTATTATAGGAGGMPPEPAVCGNGKVEMGEACDDNNAIPTDGCDENCKVEDGWVCAGDPSVCEMVINGCDSASATDMKGMSNVDITIPAQGGMLNSCIKITTGSTVTFKFMGTATQHYPVSGTWTSPDSKYYAKIGPPNENTIYCCNGNPGNISMGPFNSACCGSPFNCCNNNEMFTLPKGANPWFDDKAQDSKIRGAIYVED